MDLLLKTFFLLYYRYTRLLTRLLPTITLEGRRLHIPPSTYKPLENEHRFRDFVQEGDRILDLGCGSGVISVFAADLAESVVALDISETAVRATRDNCARNGVANVEALQSDMFEAAGGRFDRIFANPPFVEITMEGEDSQWATSTCYLGRLFSEGREFLAEDGQVVVLYPKSKTRRLTELAEAAGFRLVETRPVGPKAAKLWWTCVLYMELFFDAQFHVYERTAEAASSAA